MPNYDLSNAAALMMQAVTICVNRAQSLEANGEYLAAYEAQKCAAAIAEEFGVAPLLATVPPPGQPPVTAAWWE